VTAAPAAALTSLSREIRDSGSFFEVAAGLRHGSRSCAVRAFSLPHRYVGVPGGCFMYHGDHFTQYGDLIVLERGSWCGGWRFLVFLGWCDVGHGFTWGCCAAAKMVVFHIYEELAVRADLLSPVPVCTGFDGIKTSFTGYVKWFLGVWKCAVTNLYQTVTSVVLEGVVIVVFHLSVGVAVVVIAGCPMERGMVADTGLTYSR